MAPAAKESRYGIAGVTAEASSSTSAPPTGSTIPLRLPTPKARGQPQPCCNENIRSKRFDRLCCGCE